MAFPYLNETNVFDVYKASQKYMRPLFEPLSEYERLARNRPHPGIDKAYPKVTDGTLSSIIQKTPRRIIQQLPSGKIKTDDDHDWLPLMAQFILDSIIIPNANGQYPLIDKCWAIVEKGLTYGSQGILCEFVQRNGILTTDIKLPYIKDDFLENGKLSDADSKVEFIRAWYQESDIDHIINQSKKLEKQGIDNGWNIANLNKVKDKISQKDDLSTTPSERDKNNRAGGVEIIHALQDGVKSKFYSFHVGEKLILRTKVNKDPRGKRPTVRFYAGTDMSNPIGRGYCEQVGAMQNLLDAEVQMYQYNRALMLNPPMIKRGNWNKTQAKLAPNVLVDVGNDPTSTWEPVKIDSTSLSSFPQNYGLMKSQILNLLSSPDTSISADSGNPGFSKTQAGVKAQMSTLSIDDNFIRKSFESCYAMIMETLINLYFAERNDIETFTVDDETAEKLRKIDPSVINEKNQVRVDFKSETPKLHFYVDASSSTKEDNQEQMQILDGLLERYEKAPVLQQLIPSDKVTAIWNSIVTASGVEDPEKLSVEQEMDEQGNPVEQSQQQPQMGPQDVQAMIQQAMQDQKNQQEDPLLAFIKAFGIKWNDIPEDSKHMVLERINFPSQQASPTQQKIAIDAAGKSHDILNGMVPQPDPMQPDNQNPQSDTDVSNPSPTETPEAPQPAPPTSPSDNLTPEDQQYLQQLQQMGLSPDQAGRGLALIHHGYPAEDVLKMIGAGNG